MSDRNDIEEVRRFLTRRNLLRMGGAGGAALLAGCTSSDDGQGDETEAGTTTDDSNTQNQEGDESAVFVEGMGANPSTLDIHGDPRVPNSIIHSSIHDTLFMVDPDLEIQPHLVSDYSVNDDATQYNFTLKEGITFHNGNELTAEAVAWTFERMLDIAPEAYLLGPVENIEAVGEYEVQMDYESSFPLLTRNLTIGYTGILSPAAVEEAGDSYGQETAVGTGPFQFEEWERDQRVILSRFDEYDWGPEFASNTGPANIDEIHFRYVPEGTTLFNELTVGNIDGTTYVPTGEAQSVADHQNTSLERREFPHPVYLAINVTRPPTDEVLVRRAINHAINREAIIEAALDGEGYPILSLVPPETVNSLSEDEINELGYEYNVGRARELLDEAGWTNSSEGEVRTRDGEELSIYFTAFTINLYSRVGEVAQAMLSEVGFDVNLEILESGTLYETLEGSEHNVTTMAWSRAKYAEEVLEPTLSGENVATEGGSNYTIWDNDEFNELLSTAQSDPNEDARQEAIRDAQRVVLEEAPVAPVCSQMKHYGYKNDIDTGQWFDHPWWPEQYHLHRLEIDK